MPRKKKVAICHYRVGRTDGVSLEIKKRKQILEAHGCEVRLIAGPRSETVDYIIDELEWEDGAISTIKENGFVDFGRKDFDDMELADKIFRISDIIERKLEAIYKKEKFDYFLVHNIFCFGGHISAARAFDNIIKKYRISTIVTHHDFYWERKEFRVPRNGFLREYVSTYLPPKNKYLKHVVLSSIAQEQLKKRKGINPVVLPDIFDFSQEVWRKDNFNKGLLDKIGVKKNDLLVLQATRIVPRKGIETAIDFASSLDKRMKNLRGKRLYNNKKINDKSNLVLVLAGYFEDSDRDYYLKLREVAQEKDIKIKFVNGNINAKRSFNNCEKKFSLWDAYVYADLVTFPSIWEGWGNQFIEAVFARKPIVLWEYPVFKKDIKKEGYKFISLGDKLDKPRDNGLSRVPSNNLRKAVKKSEKWLLEPDLNKILERNFNIGKKFHGFKIVEDFLIKELEL
ncbi:glycosyltransferase family 4 protein [bacterium]|nr:glycosyltransferase family 4 protein [bacterium]